MRRTIKQLLSLMFLLIVSVSVKAQVVMEMPYMSGMEGDTVKVPVKVNNSVNGLEILSFRFRLTYNAQYLEPINVDTDSSMTNDAGWTFTYNTTDAGEIVSAGAGETALVDSGRIFNLYFKLKRPGTAYLNFDINNSYFNESIDDVPISFNNGRVSIAARPTFSFGFNPSIVVIGDSTQVNVSGAENPVTWSVTDTSKAWINGSGMLYAKNYGSVGVIAEDNRGISDTTYLDIKGFRLSSSDTTNYSGQEVMININTSDLTKLDVNSGSFFMSTSITDKIEILGIDPGDLMASDASINYNVQGNGVEIVFAQATEISGAGNLMKVRAKLKENSVFSNYTIFSNPIMNESIEGVSQHFYIRSIELPSLNITYSSSSRYMVGDSIQFNVTGYTGPVMWDVTNPAFATIDGTGLMQSQKGGTFKVNVTDSIGAYGETSNLNFYDVLVELPDSAIFLGDTLFYPVRLSNVERSNSSILAYDLTVNFNDNRLDFLGISRESTLSEGWSVVANTNTPGNAKIVAGNAFPITTNGDLVFLKFRTDTSVINNTTDYLSVSNVLFNEGSPNYVIDNGSIQISTTPLVPTLLYPAYNATDIPLNVMLDWNDAVGASTFNVQVSTNAGYSDLIVDTTGVIGSELQLNGLSGSTRYYWRVKSVNSSGESNWSNSIFFQTEDPVAVTPMLLAPADSTMGLMSTIPVSFLWNSAYGALSYEITVDDNPDFSSPFTSNTQTDTSLSLGGFLPGTQYFWRVRSNGISNTSAWSDTLTFWTLQEPPAQPAIIAPAQDSVDAPIDVEFIWSDAARADSFRIRVSEMSDFSTLTMYETLTDTSITATGLAYGTTYYWQVQSRNDAGESPFTTIRSFTTVFDSLSTPYTESPIDSTADLTTTVLFGWGVVSGASYYELHLSKSDMFDVLTHNIETPDYEVTIDDLEKGVDYYWRVRAIGPIDTSAWSDTLMFSTQPDPPAMPVLISPANDSLEAPLTVELIWSDAARADSFRVMFSDQSDFSSNVLQFNVADTIYEVSGLDFSTDYYWQVQSRNSGGESAYTSVWRFRTLDNPNNAPIVENTMGSIVLAEDFGSLVAVKLDSVFLDPDGDPLSYELLNSSTFIHAELKTDSLMLSSVQDSSGTGEFIVRAFDGDGAEVFDTLSVTVTPVNDLPIVINLPDTLSFTTGEALKFVFDTSFTDVEDDLLDLMVTVTVSPGGITATFDPTTLSVVFESPTYSGLGLITFTIEDSDGGIITAEVVIEVTLSISTEFGTGIPAKFNLDQNYPNPFNPTSNIRFGVPKTAEVQLIVYNMLGQRIKTLIDGKMEAGWHTVTFDAAGLSSGTYIYRITAGDFVQTRKMMLIK